MGARLSLVVILPSTQQPHTADHPSPQVLVCCSYFILHPFLPTMDLLFSSFLAFTSSPPHPLTTSPSHHLTPSPSHHLTLSPSHHLTLLPPHPLTTSPSHHLTLSPPHPLTLSPPHPLTLSPPHPLTLSPHLLALISILSHSPQAVR